jgi:phosphomannomutase
LAYQHSAVGRDLVVEILRALGAEVVAVGRSETFVPIDTENMDAQQLAVIQNLYDHAASDQGQFDAIVSTDGDSDRPLLLGVDAQTAKVCFFGGDLVGMLTAELLGADAVVVPISSNDGIDHGNLKNLVEPKTRIGSPYVIAGMEQALAHGKQAVCGWEANGGFLTGSDMRWQNQLLTALPTRDAVLPIVAVLFMAKREAVTLPQLFTRLPKRYSGAGLIKQFPRTQALDIVKRLSPADAVIQTVIFSPEKIVFLDVNEQEISSMNQEAQAVETIKKQLSDIFSAALGFGNIARINYTDGVRIYFDNGDVAHLRPSGNADEFRLYAVADSQQRAERIVTLAVAEPDGLLRALSRQCTEF